MGERHASVRLPGQGLLFTGFLVLAGLALPQAGDAQPAPVHRVGVVRLDGPHSATVDGLRDGLRDLGLEEGKQFILHVRAAKGDLKSTELAPEVSKRRRST